MCTDAKINAFSHFAKRIDQNREKDDGSPRRNLHLIGQEQASQASGRTGVVKTAVSEIASFSKTAIVDNASILSEI